MACQCFKMKIEQRCSLFFYWLLVYVLMKGRYFCSVLRSASIVPYGMAV
jgi:hypothetical protein